MALERHSRLHFEGLVIGVQTLPVSDPQAGLRSACDDPGIYTAVRSGDFLADARRPVLAARNVHFEIDLLAPISVSPS